MKVTLYKKDSIDSFSIEPMQNNQGKDVCVWIAHQDQGGQFNADDVSDVIYNALKKYWHENY